MFAIVNLFKSLEGINVPKNVVIIEKITIITNSVVGNFLIYSK